MASADQMNALYEPRNGYTYCGISEGATMPNASYKTGINFTICSAVFATGDPGYLCLVFKTTNGLFGPQVLQKMMENKNNDDILILCSKSGKMVSNL